jgi:hypothetical protein
MVVKSIRRPLPAAESEGSPETAEAAHTLPLVLGVAALAAAGGGAWWWTHHRQRKRP